MGEEVPVPAPGWYDDPVEHGQLRYWDGSGWTGHIHSAQLDSGSSGWKPLSTEMTSPTNAERTLESAWNDLTNLSEAAPTVLRSARELGHLVAPLSANLASRWPDAAVTTVLPGQYGTGGDDTPLGDGATVKMKALAPHVPGLCAITQDGSFAFAVAEIGFYVHRADVRSRNLISAKSLYMRFPTLELVYREDESTACVRFTFDDLPEQMAETIIKGSQ